MVKQKEDKTGGTGQPKYSSAYWGLEIQNAIKQRENGFYKHAAESISIYNTQQKLENVQRRMNVWWYVVNTLLPAFYSSTPKAEVNLRKYAGSQYLDLSAVLLERNVQHSMDMDFDFDFVGYNSALSLLLTGQAALWGRYEVKFGEPQPVRMFATETGIVDAQGMLYQGELSDLEEDGQGLFLNLETIEEQKAILETLHYSDYLSSDARNEEETKWKARRAYLTEEETESIFGRDVAKKLSFDSFPSTSKSRQGSHLDDRNPRDGKAALWEAWCEDANKVYWIQAKGKKSIVESGEVPIKFPDFYPCSVISVSLDPDSTIPTSDYAHAKDMILEVERLAERKHGMIQAIRANAIYNPTLGNKVNELFSGDLKLIPADNWSANQARGGTKGQIEYLEIDPYVRALEVISGQLEQAKQNLFQMLKVSDLLQGVSDPRKTATANRLENAWSSMGLIVRQNQFSKFVGDGIEKLGTIIASQFEPKRLLSNGSAQELLAPLVSEQMPYEMLAKEVIAPLKNSRELFKLVIASDSMVALDQRQERQDTADLLNSASSFFQQMSGFVEQYPPMAPFAVQLFEKMIRSYKGGKEMEAAFTKAISDVANMAVQKQQQAANQPPDPKVLESQTRMQIAQLDAQVRTQIEQSKAQDSREKNMVEMQRVAAQTQAETWKIQQEVNIKQQELMLDARRVEAELLKIQTDAASKQVELEIKEKMAGIDALISEMSLNVNKGETRIRQLEQLIEEGRLAADSTIRQEELALKKEELALKREDSKRRPAKKIGKVSADGSTFEIKQVDED